MPDSSQAAATASAPDAAPPSLLDDPAITLTVTLDVADGLFRFAWSRDDLTELIAIGRLRPSQASFRWAGRMLGRSLDWLPGAAGDQSTDGCTSAASSPRALLKRLRKQWPIVENSLRLGLLTDKDLGAIKAGEWQPVIPSDFKAQWWDWLVLRITELARLTESGAHLDLEPARRRRELTLLLAHSVLRISPPPQLRPKPPPPKSIPPQPRVLDLCVVFHQFEAFVEFCWSDPVSKHPVATGRIRNSSAVRLSWALEQDGEERFITTPLDREAIREQMQVWLKAFPTNRKTFSSVSVVLEPGAAKPSRRPDAPFSADEDIFGWLEDNIVDLAAVSALNFSPLGRAIRETATLDQAHFESYAKKIARKEQKRAEEEARRRETMAALAAERRRRERERNEERKAAQQKRAEAALRSPAPSAKPSERPPAPPLPIHFETPTLAFQEAAIPVPDLRRFFLSERAALWWVSNQSDDLLCLPHCRIERLEYQLRTALRVLGPLRGRALLSDEVGLGKTIEAGLIIKELLTRGMVKRFLVLTVPSLVDQWEEELGDKFGLGAATTNHAVARGDPRQFWTENAGIVASLHTLKQPAHLAIARETQWDILVVDEAHYLRNRESQAWQAVNTLPRQFLLLLTATPVQNSIEELYNLVTLLQPGQLPSPKEFRARFLNPKRPCEPREPEELRRLLGQVMIRNTRANAGLKLPPRRAETVLFEPDDAERAFWQSWEVELRACLAQLGAAQASFWGRLLLQTAGSSPAAWRSALEKFPDAQAARAWREQSPLESSWKRKCELIPPLTRGEGGVVIFTQFLHTQSALADFLRAADVPAFVVNGSTPAPERQPITEEFRRQGGALLLTHSGTEGRNLQFSHRLVNFDLPWNPMEIEQRIGRLHRLGQQHPVQIHNFVQTGTLQEHLLQILQEKLNLFELVVGETGLILGERFSSDEFAEEVFRLWRESEGRVAEAFAGLGDEAAAARDAYGQVKKLDETLFTQDYESL